MARRHDPRRPLPALRGVKRLGPIGSVVPGDDVEVARDLQRLWSFVEGLSHRTEPLVVSGLAEWLSNSGPPSSGLGKPGDYYLDTSSGDVYEHFSAAIGWDIIGNIEGPVGPAGAAGTNGVNGNTWFSGTGAPSAGLGVTGDFYLDTASGDVYKNYGGGVGWDVFANLRGPTGATGATGATGPAGPGWLSGSGAPAAGLGSTGDYYLNTANYDVWEKFVSVGWDVIGNIKGATGATGATGPTGNPGSTWHNGTGAPSSGLGRAGDYYLNDSNGDVYVKISATAWEVDANIKGPTGATGPTGPAGPADSQWYMGSGAPGSIGGASTGDNYLDTSSGGVYQHDGLGWVLRGNIKGPMGATGSQGPQGPQGATGATGATGPAGATWYSGAGAPAAGLGANNDYYLNTSNGDVYKKASGSWSVQGNIRGATGPQGANVVWLNGAGVPAAGLGADGDYYINDNNGDVYEKVAGSWGSPVVNIIGPTGPSGSGGVPSTTGKADGMWLRTLNGGAIWQSLNLLDLDQTALQILSGPLGWSDGAGSFDVQLYRLSAQNLRTDGNFIADKSLVVDYVDGTGAVYFGSALDAYINRVGAGHLHTNGDFTSAGRFFSGGAGTGGIWVDGGSQFVGSLDASTIGFYIGGSYRFQFDSGGGFLINGTGKLGFKAASGAGGSVGSAVVSGKRYAATINKPTGKVTGPAMATGNDITMVVSNSFVGPDDTVIVNLRNGEVTGSEYIITVCNVASGSFAFYFFNGGAATFTPVFSFTIIKGASS